MRINIFFIKLLFSSDNKYVIIKSQKEDNLVKNSPTDKNAKINKNKIFAYIKALQEYGTRIGKPIVKHIEGNLWELRPLSNRIFFFYWKDNKFVLVHHFIKKSQKTPRKEIETALRNVKDWIERNGN